MAKNTDNHNWNVPEEGDSDYEATFSTFFEQIDRDVEIKDTDANRSNYTPKSNAKFLATDTENVYLGDGSSWNKIASSGKNPTVERLDSTLLTHATDISENYTLDSGEGAVVAGPLTGTGSISGNGRLAVIQEGHQFTDNVDAQGNNLNNVGSVDVENADTRSGYTSVVDDRGTDVTFTNGDSDRDISVRYRIESGADVNFNFTVNGEAVYRRDEDNVGFTEEGFTITVAAGADYKLDDFAGTVNLQDWYEQS